MPRPDVSEERKEQILNAAAVVFSKLGFAQARMDDIVKESGLSKGALYWYFKSKEDIINALMHRFFDQDLESLAKLLENETSASEKLLTYIHHLVSVFEETQSLIPLIYEYYSSATRVETIREFFQTYFKAYQTLIAKIIEQGVDAGEFLAVDTHATALTLTALIEGLLLLHMIDESIELKSNAMLSIETILKGITR